MKYPGKELEIFDTAKVFVRITLSIKDIPQRFISHELYRMRSLGRDGENLYDRLALIQNIKVKLYI